MYRPAPLKAETVNDTVSIVLYDATDANTQTAFDVSPYDEYQVLIHNPTTDATATVPTDFPGVTVQARAVSIPAGTITPSGKQLGATTSFTELYWKTTATMFPQAGIYEAEAQCTAADGTHSKAASIFIEVARSLG